MSSVERKTIHTSNRSNEKDPIVDNSNSNNNNTKDNITNRNSGRRDDETRIIENEGIEVSVGPPPSTTTIKSLSITTARSSTPTRTTKNRQQQQQQHHQQQHAPSNDSSNNKLSRNIPNKRLSGGSADNNVITDSSTHVSRNTYISNTSSVATSSPQNNNDFGVVVVSSDTDASSDYRSSRNNSTIGSKTLRSSNNTVGYGRGTSGGIHGSVGARTPTHYEMDDEDDDSAVHHDDDDDNDELFDVSLAYNFMMEHRIFLRAGLSLLNERDRHAPELGMMDPIVLKSGPLKKASHLMNGVWKVKYVEIRRGMFSYFENVVSSKDSQGEGELLRKNIPLEASTVTCRAVKLHQKALALTPTGAIFELSYPSHLGHNHQHINSTTGATTMNTPTSSTTTKRLWMANSREERSVWIQAINNAMVGGSVTRGAGDIDHSGYVRNVNARSPYKNDLRKFLKAQNAIRNSRTKQDYIIAIKDTLLSRSLQIPIKWIVKQQGENGGGDSGGGSGGGGGGGMGNTNTEGAFREETVALSIDQLWKDLQRDSVNIDNVIYHGDEIHGPERILGALTKRILTVAGGQSTSERRSADDLRESQALEYARDILLAGNRTRSAGDSYYCVNTLCSNQDLVVVVPSSVPVSPVHFQVSEDNSDVSFQSRLIDKSGWIKTRSYLQRKGWTKLFFVLSEGTLSYYAGALPRPHGLRGQRFMKEKASISISKKKAPSKHRASAAATAAINNDNPNYNNNNATNANKPISPGGLGLGSNHPNASKHDPQQHNQYILSISSDDNLKDRMLLFESEDKLLDWVYALECVIKSNQLNVKKQPPRRRLSGSSIANLMLGMNPDEVAAATANTNQALTTIDGTSTAASTITPAHNNHNNNPHHHHAAAPNAMIDILASAAEATKAHAAKVGLDGEALNNRLATYARRATSAVCVSVSACTKYKVCTIDPEGDETLDTWAKVEATFLQSFRVTGGPNGRIIRGEETVRVLVTKCGDSTGGNNTIDDTISTLQTSEVQTGQLINTQLVPSSDAPSATITPVNQSIGSSIIPFSANKTSPSSNRSRMNRRMFLRNTFGSSDELDPPQIQTSTVNATFFSSASELPSG